MGTNKVENKKVENKKIETCAIFCVINRGFTDLVMVAAKKAGANGGTVIHGRGTGDKNIEKFYGITVTPEKEIVIIVVRKDIVDKVLLRVNDEAGLSSPGQGIAVALPVSDYIGLNVNTQLKTKVSALFGATKKDN